MGGGAAAHNGACARNWSTVSGIQPCRGLPHNTGRWTSAPTSRKRARASADSGWVPNLGLAPRRVLSWLDMADERGDRSRAEIDILETNHPSGRSARTRVARARSGSGTYCSRALVWAVERGLFQPVDGEIVLPNREVVSTVPLQKARMKVGGYHLAGRNRPDRPASVRYHRRRGRLRGSATLALRPAPARSVGWTGRTRPERPSSRWRSRCQR